MTQSDDRGDWIVEYRRVDPAAVEPGDLLRLLYLTVDNDHVIVDGTAVPRSETAAPGFDLLVAHARSADPNASDPPHTLRVTRGGGVHERRAGVWDGVLRGRFATPIRLVRQAVPGIAPAPVADTTAARAGGGRS